MEILALTKMCADIQKLQNAQTKVVSSFVERTVSSARLSYLNELIASPNAKVINQAVRTIKYLIDLKKFVAKTPSLAIKLKCLSIENLPNIIPYIERWMKNDTFFENQTLIDDMTPVISDLVYSRLNHTCSRNNHNNCNHVTKIFTIICGLLGRYNNCKVNQNNNLNNNTATNDDGENCYITDNGQLKTLSIKAWFAVAHAWGTHPDTNIPSEYVIYRIYISSDG